MASVPAWWPPSLFVAFLIRNTFNCTRRKSPYSMMANTRRTTTLPIAMSLRVCRVTVCDMEGVKHSVEVTASTPYEAVEPGLVAIPEQDWAGEIAEGFEHRGGERQHGACFALSKNAGFQQVAESRGWNSERHQPAKSYPSDSRTRARRCFWLRLPLPSACGFRRDPLHNLVVSLKIIEAGSLKGMIQVVPISSAWSHGQVWASKSPHRAEAKCTRPSTGWPLWDWMYS